MGKIIKYERSIIIACDVKTMEEFRKLIEQTYDIEGVTNF
jgi:hypothetical protein